MERIFKTLLVCSFLLYVVWMGSFYFAYAFFTPVIADAITHSGAESTFRLPEFVFWLMPILWLIALAGMWQFSQSARTFYIVLIVVGFLATAISGILIQSASQAVIADIISLCDGAVIAMAYFTSLDARFRENASNKPFQPTAESGG